MIECWITEPDGTTYLAHADRSQASPFRNFAVSRMRGADPGTGSLEHHLDNDLTRDGTLLADGNLVHMKYRGKTLTWVIEERTAVLDAQEHSTDWVRVTGRGVKQLIGDRTVWPTAFAETVEGLDPATWGKDNQWYRVVNRAAGEMLWDMIAESNPRFPTQLVRGTIETTGADGWTQDFRFDSLLDVVRDVAAAYGDIDMDGLTFSYRNAPGTDRSATVIFEEGADLLRVERTTSDRDTATWAVAEGVGEGVTAKLAVAKDTTATRRREVYSDAKDAGNLPLVQLRADGVISEMQRADSIALEVTEERFAAFTDYDLWDRVRVIAPGRGIDELGVIVAMYLAEVGEQVRVLFDVNSPRTEYLLGLEAGNRSTARSVGVRNRMPQGSLAIYPITGGGQFDSDDTAETHIWIPDRVNFVVRSEVAVMIRPFKAPAKSASSGGGATGGSSSSSTSSEKTLTLGMDSGTVWGTTGAASAGTAHTHGDGDLALGGSVVNGIDPHSHTNPHVHDGTVHTHPLVYGIQSEAMPATWSAILKVYERTGGTWTLRGTFSGLTDEDQTVVLTAVPIVPGRWRLDLLSAAGQPNGGRLMGYISGFVEASIQSA